MCKAWEDRFKHDEKHGEMIKLIKQVCKKIIKGKSVDDIADDLEEDVSLITKIVDAAKAFAPEYNAEDIYTDLRPLGQAPSRPSSFEEDVLQDNYPNTQGEGV